MHHTLRARPLWFAKYNINHIFRVYVKQNGFNIILYKTIVLFYSKISKNYNSYFPLKVQGDH